MHSCSMHGPWRCTKWRHKLGFDQVQSSRFWPSRHLKPGHCNVLSLSYLDLQSGCQQYSSGRRSTLQHDARAKINTVGGQERQKTRIVIWAWPKAVTVAAGEGGSETLGKGSDRSKYLFCLCCMQIPPGGDTPAAPMSGVCAEWMANLTLAKF